MERGARGGDDGRDPGSPPEVSDPRYIGRSDTAGEMWWRKGKADAEPHPVGEPSSSPEDVGEPVRRVASGGIGDVPLAFAGRVYYVTDGMNGEPIAGWPPKLAGRGFRKPASQTRRAPAKGRDDGEAEEADAEDLTGAPVRRFPPTLSRADAPPTPPVASTHSSVAASIDDGDEEDGFVFPRSHRRRDLGSSAYFLTEDLAWRWRDAIIRPLGLWQFPRRRLFRPSDVPLGPCGVSSMPMGDAYRRLCVGWGNPVLAAQVGVACEESQKTLAAELVGLAMRDAGDETNPLAVKGRNGRIVGDGVARNMVGLLTGYLADGDDETNKNDKSVDSNTSLFARVEDKPMRAGTWAADAVAAFVSDLKRDLKEATDADGDGKVSLDVTVPGGAGPDGSIATWRRVARQLANSTQSAARHLTGGGVVHAGRDPSAATGEGGDAPSGGGETAERTLEKEMSTPEEEPRIEDATAAEYDLLLTAYAQRPELSWADDSFPVDKPVFSSPHVHVRVNRESGTSSNDGVEKVGADTYRPWFFDMEDLNRILRRAVAIEARKAAGANAERRVTFKRLMALTVTALANTKPNEKLGPFAIPGLTGKGGSKQGGGGGGGLISDGKDDIGDVPSDEDDEEEDMMDGLDDGDEDESLNDDELMREYMREMVKDGTAEEMLGAWTQAAQQGNNPLGGKKKGGRGSNAGDGKQEVNIGPFAHFAMVHGFTIWFGACCAWWGFANKLDTFLCDKGGWVGQFLMVQNTEFADMMQNVEVGTFEGICAASLASGAARDVSERIVAGTAAREKRLRAASDGLKATDARLEECAASLERHDALAVRTRSYLNEMHARNAQAAREAAEEAAAAELGRRLPRRKPRRGKESKGNGPEDGIAPEMLPPANLRTEADFARLEQELVVMREELVALTRDRDERRARLLRAVQEDIESTVSDTFESARFAEGLRAASGQFNGAKAVQLVDAHTGRALDTEGGSVGGDGASVSPRLVLTGGPAAAKPVLDTPPLFVADLGETTRGLLGSSFGGPAGWLKDAESSSYVIKA